MKTFIICCVAFSAILVLSEATKFREGFRLAYDECLKEMNLTKEDFKILAENKDEKEYCVFACIHEKLKLFDGSKYDLATAHEAVQEEADKFQQDYTADLKSRTENCVNTGNSANGGKCKKTSAFLKCINADQELMRIIDRVKKV